MRRSYTFLVCAFLTVLSTPLAAQNTATTSEGCRMGDDPTDCKDAFAFFHMLKAAVSHNQRDIVARMVNYPLMVTIDNKPARIGTRQSFLAHYDEIINPAERCAITVAKDSDVWGNSHGYTIDRGALWWEKFVDKDDEKPGQEIDWAKVPFKLLTFNNINVMTKACMRLNLVQALSPDFPGRPAGIVLKDFRPAEAFFSRFQKAVATDDREAVADMVLYPVKLGVGGKQKIAKEKAHFLQLYDSLFQAQTKATLMGEHGSDLTAWWEGISDPGVLVEFSPVSGTDEFLITHLADSPPKRAIN